MQSDLHQDYADEGMLINHGIEYNNRYAAQFNALELLVVWQK